VIDMRELEAFLAVAEELHFGRAAARLRVTTSNVSQTIRALERRVGGPLFVRTSRVVRLTPPGEQLLAEWRPAYEQLQRGLRNANQAAASSPATLRVGYPATLLPGMHETLAKAYQAARPGHRVLWVPVSLTALFTWDRDPDAALDVIVCWLPPGDLGSNTSQLRIGPPIRREQPALMMPAGHQLAGRATIDVEDLADCRMLWPDASADSGMDWAPVTTPSGRPIPQVRRPCLHLEGVVAAIEDDNLVHVVLARFADVAWSWLLDRMAIIPLTGRGPFTCRAVWPASKQTTAVSDFAEVCAASGADAGWLDITDDLPS
jgi:DNA-binding transcriptional LysR family regulator